MVNRSASDDPRALGGLYDESRSEMNVGPSLFSDLYPNNNALKWILCLIGSQWKDLRIGMMWSNVLVFVSTLAAAFWICCSWQVTFFDRPICHYSNPIWKKYVFLGPFGALKMLICPIHSESQLDPNILVNELCTFGWHLGICGMRYYFS